MHTRFAVVLLIGALCVQTGADGASLVMPPYERIQLDNGTVVVMMPRHDVPLIGFTALLRGGAIADPSGKAGVASLTASLLEKGAGKRNAYQFADAVEGAGGSFAAGAGSEAITISGQFLAKDRDLILELLADALQRPRFEQAEFASLRDRQVQLLKAAKDADPSELIRTYGRALLFDNDPLGSPQTGSERTLAALSRDDVLAYYRAHFGADRLTLIFTGDFEPAALKSAVARAFGKWARASGALPQLKAAARVTDRKVLLVDQPGAAQTHFWIGNVGVARKYADRAPLDVVNTLFGGRFTSILNTELRIKSGLSYSAFSNFSRGSVPGEFAIRSFTQTDTTERAVDLALETLAHLKKTGPPPEQLPSARNYVLGQYPLRLETAAHWAVALSELELYDLDRSSIEGYSAAVERVSPEDAQRVVNEAFPAPEKVVIVLIGDAAKIRQVAKKYGPVTEMKLLDPDFAPRR